MLMAVFCRHRLNGTGLSCRRVKAKGLTVIKGGPAACHSFSNKAVTSFFSFGR